MLPRRRASLSLLLLLTFIAATTRSQAAGPEVVTVSGRVVAADTDAPVRQALVLVWGDKTRTLRAVVSDDSGRFTIANLPDDSYHASASKRPLIAATAAVAGDQDIVLRLTRGAAISGTITTATGLPANGVSVTARGDGVVSTASTDDRGLYRIHSLPAGEYTITADRAPAPFTAAVAAGEDRQGVNFVLAAPPPVQTGIGGPGSIAGQLIDRDTLEPIGGATVGLSGPSPRQTVTDTLGAFTFRDLTPDTYTVQVDDPRYRAIGSARIAPTTEAVADVPLRAVQLAALTGRVQDDAGDPAVGVTVFAFRRTELGFRPMMVPRMQSTTDDRGEYWMGGLPDGEYMVCVCDRPTPSVDASLITSLTGGRATAEQIAALVSQLPVTPPVFYPGRGTVSNAVVLTLEPGDERAGTDISLWRVPGRRVTGRLTATDTRILERTTMRLLASGDIPEAVALTEIEPASISPRGEFEFFSVPEGDYTLAAFSMEEDAAQYAAVPLTVGAQDVTDVMLAMTAGTSVRGRVDLAGGATLAYPPSEVPRVSFMPLALSPASLLLVGISGNAGYSISVDPDGTFLLEGLPPGRYIVTATGFPSPWHALESIGGTSIRAADPTVDITGGGSQTLVLTMGEERAATMAGTVELDPFESPQGARVALFPADERTWPELYRVASRVLTTTIDARFRYEFGDIPPGDYIAVVLRSGELEWTPRNLEWWAKRGEHLTLASGSAERRELSGR